MGLASQGEAKPAFSKAGRNLHPPASPSPVFKTLGGRISAEIRLLRFFRLVGLLLQLFFVRKQPLAGASWLVNPTSGADRRRGTHHGADHEGEPRDGGWFLKK